MRESFQQLAAMAAMAFWLGGCVTVSNNDVAQDAPAGAVSGPVEQLVAQANSARVSGDPARAAASIERALRIDGRNPSLYLTLARIRLEQGQPAQAIGLARRAQALAPRDPAVATAVNEIVRASDPSAPRRGQDDGLDAP